MRVLILGGTGFVGLELGRFLRELGHEALNVGHLSSSPSESSLAPGLGVDISDREGIDNLLKFTKPDAVVNCAAIASVPICERSPQLAEAVNAVGVAKLVASMEVNCPVPLVHLSTDMVFSGELGNYSESDEALPTTIYGRTKLLGEQSASSYQGPVVILRPSLIIGDQGGYLKKLLTDVRAGKKIYFFNDEWRTPTYIKDLVKAIAVSLLTVNQGAVPRLMHIGGSGRASRLDIGRMIFDIFSLDSSLLNSVSRVEVPGNENRPRDCSLDSSLLMESLSLRLTGLSDALFEIHSACREA